MEIPTVVGTPSSTSNTGNENQGLCPEVVWVRYIIGLVFNGYALCEVIISGLGYRMAEFAGCTENTLVSRTWILGAGYISIVVRAVKSFVLSSTRQMIDIQHLRIRKALVVDEDNEGVEVLFTLRSRSL